MGRVLHLLLSPPFTLVAIPKVPAEKAHNHGTTCHFKDEIKTHLRKDMYDKVTRSLIYNS